MQHFYFIFTDLECGTNLMFSQPETECLREDRRDGSCMVMDDSVDSVTIVPISHSSTLSSEYSDNQLVLL